MSKANARRLKKISASRVEVFKVRNRRSYAAICMGNLCEGTTPKQAVRRLYHPLRRMGFELILSLTLFTCAPIWAAPLDVPAKQVQLEAKIADVSQDAAKQLGVEYTIYQPVDGRDAKAEFAFVVSPTFNDKFKIEVTSIVFGRGSEFRRWAPQNPQIVLEPKDYGEEHYDEYYEDDEEGPPPGQIRLSPELLQRIEAHHGRNERLILRPEVTEKIYVPKMSIAAPAAALLFAAIGTQYTKSGEAAAASPGTACASSGSHGSSGGGGGGASEAIDRVGMAAGLGLLASQAKGQLDGQKTVFISDVPFGRFLFKTEAYNKDKRQLIVFTTPVIIRAGEEP